MSSPYTPPSQSVAQVPVPEGYAWRDIQLEMSLKPFFDNTPETRRRVCNEIFHQWLPLVRHAETISIMLWIGDGSEILEYNRDLETPFEWGRYQGSANPHEWKLTKRAQSDNPDDAATGVHVWTESHDPDGRGLHRRPYLYRETPAEFNFSWLRDLVSDLKAIGHAITGKTILVGDTFDIGPEFAKSRFKYEWHPEILAGGNALFKGQFVSCEAVLQGDTRAYAGYPNGIPDGTGFGTFFGRQLAVLFEDIGFDFLWLSNGFGFALEPWALVGNLFDGANFLPDAAPETRKRILRFWHDLRAEFPTTFPIRTRGTNLATGIDLGSDASPLRDIYESGFNVEAPVNSPWAALDADFGLELSGWMSHIARHPGETFRFRYYIHDPWWKNSPYLDRYERNPHDLFLPCAVSRVTSDGAASIARDLSFLSIDDSDGCMPLSVPAEVTAHLLRAREFAPDDAGPIVWLYPFDDFHEMALSQGMPEKPFSADTFIGTVINDSVPLNTVMDLAELPTVLAARPNFAEGRVFLSPTPLPGSRSEQLLETFRAAGATLLLYGPLAPGSVFLAPLGLTCESPLEGDFSLSLAHTPYGESNDSAGDTLRHTNFLSAGGFCEAAEAGSSTDPRHLATATLDGQSRIPAACVTSAAGGNLGWVRGSLSTAEFDPEDPEPIRGPILRSLPADTFFPYGRLLRYCLDALGWTTACADQASSQRPPYVTIHRHRDAFIYSGYHPDENARLVLHHPLGAPLLTSCTVPLEAGNTIITGTRAWSHEARVFVESGDDGLYRCQFLMPIGYQVRRRLLIHGCRAATLHFLLESHTTSPVRILRNPVFPYLVGEFVDPEITETPYGRCIRIDNVEGKLMIEF